MIIIYDLKDLNISKDKAVFKGNTIIKFTEKSKGYEGEGFAFYKSSIPLLIKKLQKLVSEKS